MIDFLKNVIVMTSMDVEHNALLAGQAVDQKVLSQTHNIYVHICERSGVRVRILKSGVGSVNAAITLAIALESESADAVVLLGVGGALVPELNIGDLVIAEAVIQHDSIFTSEESAILMSPGELYLTRETKNEFSDPVIKADPELVSHFVNALEHSNAEGRVFRGYMASGSEFVACADRKKKVSQLAKQALIVDMEAAAVAQICRKQRISFVIAKTVADRLYPDGSIASDYQACVETAAKRAGRVLELICKHSMENRTSKCSEFQNYT